LTANIIIILSATPEATGEARLVFSEIFSLSQGGSKCHHLTYTEFNWRLVD